MKNTLIMAIIISLSCIQCKVRPEKPPSNVVHIPARTIIYVCEDENGEEAKCEYDEDCCEGFVCVKELNTNKKSCMHE